MALSVVFPFKGFCLKCGPRSRACEKFRRGECPHPRVYTLDDESRKSIVKLWRRGREECSESIDPKRFCEDSSNVLDGCFEDDWLD